jgi:hypothetical protein
MGKFDYHEYQQYKAKRPWLRTKDSLVAVNPERITTLWELAVKHYGKKCARCSSKKKLCVHHRHYRTIGFEKPVEDIVLLCGPCHQNLHERGNQKQLNRDDSPYVDPWWAERLALIGPDGQLVVQNEGRLSVPNLYDCEDIYRLVSVAPFESKHSAGYTLTVAWEGSITLPWMMGSSRAMLSTADMWSEGVWEPDTMRYIGIATLFTGWFYPREEYKKTGG